MEVSPDVFCVFGCPIAENRKKYTKAERDEIEPDRTKQSDMFPSKSTLENEINNIVFIPTWFHNYLHSNKVPRLRTRKDYYKMLKLVLLTENSYNEIKSLSLNNSSVSNALKSIQNLASNMPDQNKNELIEYLRIVYDEVQSKLLDDLLQ